MAEFRHVDNADLELGIRYALETYKITLDRDVLRLLSNETGKLRNGEGKEFQAARQQAAMKILTQRHRIEGQRYLAYIGAVGKIFNSHSQKSKASKKIRQVATKPLPKEAARAELPPENAHGQFEFVLHQPR